MLLHVFAIPVPSASLLASLEFASAFGFPARRYFDLVSFISPDICILDIAAGLISIYSWNCIKFLHTVHILEYLVVCISHRSGIVRAIRMYHYLCTLGNRLLEIIYIPLKFPVCIYIKWGIKNPASD
jgi:hypothetical protein